MPVTHVNRRGQTYFLHAGTTKTGKSRYWFSMKDDGTLVESIPEGYGVYENPDCQVFLRKIVPQLVTLDEVAVVEDGLERFAPDQNCIVDVQEEHIVVYHAVVSAFCCTAYLNRFILDWCRNLSPGSRDTSPEVARG